MDYGLRYSRASTKLAQYPLISVVYIHCIIPLLICMYGIFYQLLLALLDMFFAPGNCLHCMNIIALIVSKA